jgi:hypothetical protein
MSKNREKITIYKFSKPHPNVAPREIRKADIKRDWMNFNHFYRCLPMTISNQNGWVVECPAEFKASWIGGDDPNNIHFWVDKSNKFERKWVDSIFGHGIITFFMDFVVRTPPGVNLLVRGAPNFYVDNCHPLEGLVETDWLNYSFTMNWRITNTDRIVHFKKGDPICYFHPVPHNYSENFDVEIDLLDNNPELKERFLAYDESRSSFRRDKKRGEYWQGHYFRGEDVFDGCPVGKDVHSIKLNIAEPVSIVDRE